MDIKFDVNEFVNKFFDKKEKFPFFVVRMLYLSSNIPSLIFYGSVFSKFLQIGQCTLRFCAQGRSVIYYNGNIRWKASILLVDKKAFQNYAEKFSKYCKTYDEIINKVISNLYLG